jgi:hypothetical protein
MIEVNPQDFLGNVPCAEGSMRRYVATLTDVTNVAMGAGGGAGSDETGAGGAQGVPFVLPSSLPTPCNTSVGFGYVVPFRSYQVTFDGYDRDDIEPRGAGTRQMVTRQPDPEHPDDPARATVSVVQPHERWTVECTGVQTQASAATIVRARGCSLDDEDLANQSGSVRFDTGALLGELSCGGEVQQLSLAVSFDGGPETELPAVDCGTGLVFDAGTGRHSIRAYVRAFASESTTAFAGAECHALTTPGAAVVASCARLTETGTLRVELEQALEELGLGCDASISELQVLPLNQSEQRFLPPRCLQPFDSEFPAGPASITVSASKDGEPLGSVTCNEVVLPGRQVTAICEPTAAQ